MKYRLRLEFQSDGSNYGPYAVVQTMMQGDDVPSDDFTRRMAVAMNPQEADDWEIDEVRRYVDGKLYDVIRPADKWPGGPKSWAGYTYADED